MLGINKKTLEKAGKTISKLVDKEITSVAQNISSDICEHIRENGSYRNITGNTRGSIAFGVFINGKLVDVQAPFAKAYTKRKTLIAGEKYKRFTAPTGDSSYYGYEESINFIEGYTPSTKNGFQIVFAVGTDYAEYVEVSYRKNVMTQSFFFAKMQGKQLILNNNFLTEFLNGTLSDNFELSTPF
jgi:hypothetical protein